MFEALVCWSCTKKDKAPNLCNLFLSFRSNIQVGSLEVGSLHTAPIRAPISPLDLMGAVWEPYGRLPTYKLPSCNGL